MAKNQPTMQFVGLDFADTGGSGSLRFEITGGEETQPVISVRQDVERTGAGTTDAMIAQGLRAMSEVAAKWASDLLQLAVTFEGR